MPVLNTEKILTGTDQKKLITAFDSLSHNYTQESARNYQTYYKNKPLSFLIENASFIFREPNYGRPFMEWVATNCPMTYANRLHIKESMEDYVTENEHRMHSELKEAYRNTCDRMDAFLESISAEGSLEAHTLKNEDLTEAFDSTYGVLRNTYVESAEGKKMFEDVMLPHASKEEMILALEDVGAKASLLYFLPYAKELDIVPKMEKAVITISKGIGQTPFLEKADVLNNCDWFQKACLSDRFIESVETSFTNGNARCIAAGLLSTDVCSEILSTYNEAALNTFHPIYFDLTSAVNSIMEESTAISIYNEDVEETKENLYTFKHAIYESVLEDVTGAYEILSKDSIYEETPLFSMIKESMEIPEGTALTIENALQLMIEAVSELEGTKDAAFFEIGKDGQADKVIQNNHTMYREIPKQQMGKKSTTGVDEEEDDDELSDEENQEIPKSTRVAGNTSNTKSTNMSADLPSSSNPNATKPSKPKKGFFRGIQSAALNAHAASRKGASKLRAIGKSAAGAGTAVLKIPEGIVNQFKKMISTFDEMDDDRRKQYMITPGYRKKVLRNCRIAAMYGLGAYMDKMFVPIIWLGRKLSKEKNKRIRMEFAKDLETEIKVTEAKIEDAQSAGDQKQRYQLIRLKDKLQREHDRVLLNGKYI